MSLISFSVTPNGTLPSLPLENGILEDYIDCTDSVGLTFHILECGLDELHPKPLVLLLHGYPELAYSWRKVMPAIASAGYHCVAVDQRGYGRTTGWSNTSYHDTDLQEYTLFRYATDVITLVQALGYKQVQCLVGHDAGSAIASTCALVRPDMFKTLVLMSHPFNPIPEILPVRRRQYADSDESAQIERDPDIQTSLANLDPPRKPYKWYNATPQAADDWDNPKQGLGSFLRGYFHLKSAVYHKNVPFPLKSWTAGELQKMPNYYVMPLHMSMPETVEADMANEDLDATKDWLPDEDLEVYVDEWARTGFQRALNFYRVATDLHIMHGKLAYSGAKITVPCQFISGDKDWGNYQEPGALQNMEKSCENFHGTKMVRGAGHWPQQEQPGQVVADILSFIWQVENPRLRTPRIGPPSRPPSHASTPCLRALSSAPLRSSYPYTTTRNMPQSPPLPRLETAPVKLASAPLRSAFPHRATSAISSEDPREYYRADTPIVERGTKPSFRGFRSAAKIPSMGICEAESPTAGSSPFHSDDAFPVEQARAESNTHLTTLTASDAEVRRMAAAASDSNVDVYRKVMEKTQLDLNREHTQHKDL